jgi:hypothetical protein
LGRGGCQLFKFLHEGKSRRQKIQKNKKKIS